MNELVTTDVRQQTLDNRPRTTNVYELALMAEPISEMTLGGAMVEIGAVVSRCLQECGRTMEGPDYELLCQGIWEEAKLRYRSCTIAELQLLMSNGVRLEYGEYFGLNLATVSVWMKAYTRSAERIKAKQMSTKELEPELTPEQAHEEWKKIVQRDFKKYKETGVLNIAANFLYLHLEKSGQIKLTGEEKKPFYYQAAEQLCERMRNLRVRGHRLERNAATSYLNRSACGQLTDKEKADIRQAARLICIKRYYDGIAELVL